MIICQAFTFEAAHRLPNVPDTHRCKRMHGHSYRVEIILEGPVDPHSGFVIDFFDLEAVCGPVIEKLDHRCLNDIEDLANPTAENIALWIWKRVSAALPNLASVKLFETPHSWVEYRGN
jgi:6-pyruvoyltetrahydropterin/6-carboxytetrahydropterin synthase